MNNKIPCINCLCIPICKNKSLPKLLNDCNLAWLFVYMNNTEYTVLATAQTRYRTIHLYLNTGIVKDET
jgi:hypothetical protein